MSSSFDVELANPPKDGISALRFFKESDTNTGYLVAASWDGSVQVYDIQLNKLVSRMFPSGGSPLLDAAITQDGWIWTGGLSGTLHWYHMLCLVFSSVDWKSEQVVCEIKEAHSAPIKSVVSLSRSNYFVSGGWDSRLCLWKSTCNGQDGKTTAQLLSSVDVPERIYTIDAQHTSLDTVYRIVVGMAGRQIHIFEVDLVAPELACVQRRESSLKYQTRTIRLSPLDPNSIICCLCTVFACGSIEGRVSVDYFEEKDQAKKYAFKCHRSTLATDDQEPTEIVYPVNAIAFHPRSLVFATGGSDGSVCLWDLVAKKRLKIFPSFPTSIAALDFDVSGRYLAIASSYCYEEGEKE